MNDIDPAQARDALSAADHAEQQTLANVGLPRMYWWCMAAGWLALGAIGQFGPAWLVTVATVAFGVGHSVVAQRYLDGRRGSRRLQLSRTAVSRRVPAIVIGILVGLVAITIAAAVALNADGTDHPTIWAAVIVAMIVGFGGPEIFATLRRWLHA
ncbi:hypothetical protein [Jongsikchunia kroppenstedtii]|uniref:hypothetical protein n=1 Tax=Jongsikchunia kroppenstedtii TaxID=1121721 RepID=UPI00036F2501|nr:hypothetical protein [Jongsikchunia kroppenstedtii]